MKTYTLYFNYMIFNYMIFWKKENSGDNKIINVWQSESQRRSIAKSIENI